MVLLGILCVAVAVGFAVDLVLENTDNVDVAVLGRTFEVRPGVLLAAGVAVAVLLAIGVRLVRVGMRRMRHRRSTLREARDLLAARERDGDDEHVDAEPTEATGDRDTEHVSAG